jgi:peroxiredoxin Q/BCP
MFRDKYEPLTSGGLSIYGLSTDSPKANTTFQTKQNLPYPLLCDPSASLIGSLGLKKSPKGTIRGVFAVDKTGKVLLLQPGSPVATVEAVEELVNKDTKDESKEEEEEEAKDK